MLTHRRLAIHTLMFFGAVLITANSARATVIFSDGTFSGVTDGIDNTASPSANTWYTPTGGVGEAEGTSVTITGDAMRTGFGYDVTNVRYFSDSIQLDTSGNTDYVLTVDIDIENQLNNDLGIVVVFGAAESDGDPFTSIANETYFRADDTEVGFTTVSYTIDGADIVAAGLTAGVDNFLALRFFHPSNGGGAGRNDVWLVDNLLVEAVTPEPSTLLLFALGLTALGVQRRPRRCRK